MAHGLAGNWQTLFGLRALLGFAEGSANPAGMKATARMVSGHERGLAGGFFNMGASLGSMLAAPLVAWAILTHSWQFAFVLTGADRPRVGRALAGLLRPPARHRALSPAERDYILCGQESHLAGDGTPAIATLLRQRNFWGIAIPRFLADPTWGTLTFWLPLYLTTVRGFDLKQIAHVRVAAVPRGGPRLHVRRRDQPHAAEVRRHAPDRRAAQRVHASARCMMMGVAFAGTVQNPYVAVALLSLAGFAHQTLSVTVITMASDLFKRNEVATVAGMAGTCGNAGVLIFSLLMGALVARIGYTPFFIGLAALDLLGAVVLWTRRARHRGSEVSARCRVAIRNPILRGFNPDPSIVRVGERLLHRDVDLRVVPGRADPSLARPRALAAGDAAAEARQSARHARRPRFVRRLGAVSDASRRAVPSGLHRREALRPILGGRRAGRIAARFPQLPGDQRRRSTATGPSRFT